MADIVQIQGLTKNYGEGEVVTRALRGVDLTLEAGEFSAMAGPSGSGKSTLLNIYRRAGSSDIGDCGRGRQGSG